MGTGTVCFTQSWVSPLPMAGGEAGWPGMLPVACAAETPCRLDRMTSEAPSHLPFCASRRPAAEPSRWLSNSAAPAASQEEKRAGEGVPCGALLGSRPLAQSGHLPPPLGTYPALPLVLIPHLPQPLLLQEELGTAGVQVAKLGPKSTGRLVSRAAGSTSWWRPRVRSLRTRLPGGNTGAPSSESEQGAAGSAQPPLRPGHSYLGGGAVCMHCNVPHPLTPGAILAAPVATVHDCPSGQRFFHVSSRKSLSQPLPLEAFQAEALRLETSCVQSPGRSRPGPWSKAAPPLLRALPPSSHSLRSASFPLLGTSTPGLPSGVPPLLNSSCCPPGPQLPAANPPHPKEPLQGFCWFCPSPCLLASNQRWPRTLCCLKWPPLALPPSNHTLNSILPACQHFPARKG